MKKLDGSFRESDKAEASTVDNNKRLQNQQYLEDALSALESGLSKTFDRDMVLAGAQKRKLNSPSIETSEGFMRGAWYGSLFLLDDGYVPEKYNDAGLTMVQIKKKLHDNYGINVEGISYAGHVADFSSISVASIPIVDIVRKSVGISREEYDSLSQRSRTELFQTVFSNVTDGRSKREVNFDYADQIAAERQIPIPGLSGGYTASQLKKWRSENKFSWDEQVNAGYNLVPTIIHGNISHTGLVSTSSSAHSF